MHRADEKAALVYGRSRRSRRQPSTPGRAAVLGACVVSAVLAAGCGTASTVVIPATAGLSMTQAAQRLCDAGVRVRILEHSMRGTTTAVPAPSGTPPRVLATGTTPAAGSAVARRAIVELRVEAPLGTFLAIRLPEGCRAPTGGVTG